MRNILVIGSIIIGILLALFWTLVLLLGLLLHAEQFYMLRGVFAVGTLVAALVLFSLSCRFASTKRILEWAAFILVMLVALLTLVAMALTK
jgi:hypothetical protein